MPHKLLHLIKRSKTIDDIWDSIYSDVTYYEDEILFIKRQWYYRLNGYWFFCNGKPTYITGQHFFYLNYWNMDVGLPKYRDRDRRLFMFIDYAMKTKKDYFGNEYPHRTCAGINYIKHRRAGATYMAKCIQFEMITRHFYARAGSQDMNDDKAYANFREKLVQPFKKIPFFFMPKYDGNPDPKSEIVFSPRQIITKENSAEIETGLESVIDYSASNIGAYDGAKLLVYHGDELGKTTNVNVFKRHYVIKETLMQGDIINGFGINTTTVGEINYGGGMNFLRICEQSFYHKDLNIKGQTASGFWNVFIPAYDGLEGYIDKYGNSVIDEPTEEQRKEGFTIGAKQYLISVREQFEKQNDYEGLAEYIRKFPFTFRECFNYNSEAVGFNIQKIDKRLNELRFQKDITIKGNFMRQTQDPDSDVMFVEDEINGKFTVSYLLPPAMANKRIRTSNGYAPEIYNKFIVGADPFKFAKTMSRRKSNGGGAVFRLFDPEIDNVNKDVTEWQTNTTVCTYNCRVDDPTIYAEDMLMLCQYYNALIYPENNLDIIETHFINRGYTGYLKYDIDKLTGKMKQRAGRFSDEKTKQEMFSKIMAYIENHICHEKHSELIIEFKNIKSIDDMTNYDLFTAFGFCLLGIQQEIMKDDEDTNYDLSDILTIKYY